MRVSQSRGMQAERQPRVVSIDTSTFPCTLRKAHVRVSTGSVRPVHTDMYVIRAAARETERETYGSFVASSCPSRSGSRISQKTIP